MGAEIEVSYITAPSNRLPSYSELLLNVLFTDTDKKVQLVIFEILGIKHPFSAIMCNCSANYGQK